MKALIAVVALLFVMVAGLGVFLFASGRNDPAGTASHVDSSSARSATASAAEAAEAAARAVETAQRLDVLARDLADLRAEIAELKAGVSRSPAAAPEKGEDITTGAFAALHRASILQVIAEDRAEQQRKREEEQRQREMENLLARADRAAKRFGLDAGQQKLLADVYVLERQRMEDLRTKLRDQAGWQDNPEGMRTAFQEMRDWRLNELSSRLGADLAQKINEAEFDRMRGGMGGPGMPGAQGGGGRRNRQQDGEGGQPGAGGGGTGGG